jgi:hypothetical protein
MGDERGLREVKNPDPKDPASERPKESGSRLKAQVTRQNSNLEIGNWEPARRTILE